MEKLIHDLLAFSRVDARGDRFLHQGALRRDFGLRLRNLYTLVEENQAIITRDSLPWINGDPVQLARLFQNLLVNSIKYRAEELPRIHVAAWACDGEWLFSVRDDGIGIQPQYAEKVFGIFKCLQPHETRPRVPAWAWQSAGRS